MQGALLEELKTKPDTSQPGSKSDKEIKNMVYTHCFNTGESSAVLE